MKSFPPNDVPLMAPSSEWRAALGTVWLTAALYAMLAAIALYPIYFVAVPPLVDYPNHLARMHILARWEEIPALQQNYAVHWTLQPNMAMDLIVPQLARFMSIYTAGKVFIAATMMMLVGGTVALRKVLYGRVGLWPVLSFLLLYNHALFWGFLNYLFAAGLALLAFSGWIALRERPCLFRAMLFSGASFVIFVAHLFGLLVYGLLIFGYECWRMRAVAVPRGEIAKAWTITTVQFLVPAALFVRWAVSQDAAVKPLNEYGSIATKAVALMSPVHFGLPWIDIPTMIFLALVFALCRSDKSIGFAGPLKLPVLLLALAAIAMPNYLFGVWGTDLRLPTIIACIAIAGVRIGAQARRTANLVLLAAIAMFAVRTGAISHTWADFDRKFREFRDATALIEVGSKVIAIEDEEDVPDGKLPIYGMQFWHLAALAIVERSVFLPTLFTGHVAVDAAPDLKKIDTPAGIPVSRHVLKVTADSKKSPVPLGYEVNRYNRIYWVGWPENFDYAVSVRFVNSANPFPALLAPIGSGTFFDIYRVIKPSSDKP